MEPIKRGQLEHNIESATVVFLDTGESKMLETKPNSACHFFEPFQIENDTVTLRLDWSDLDGNGNPTLDAGFSNSKTNKKRSLKGHRRSAHHTSSLSEGGRSYCWEFRDCKRPFDVSVCWLAAASLKGESSFTASAKVVRSTNKEPK